MLLVKSCTPIGAHASCEIFKPYWENIIVIPTKAWKSTRKNSGADPKKTGAAAVCAISHHMGRTFLCMEIPLTRGNLLEKIPGAGPQKMGADKEKLHTKNQKLIAHVSCIPNMSSSTLVPLAGSQCFLSLVAPSNVTTTVSM
jgi:hypothetical protein